MDFMWAYGDEPFSYHDDYDYFSFTIDAADDSVDFDGDVVVDDDDEVDSSVWFLTHGIVLYIAWGFFGTFMIISGRHLLSFWKKMYLVHRTMGDCIFVTSLYFEYVAYQKVGSLADTHNKLGFYFIFLGASLGFMGNVYAAHSYAWVTNVIPIKFLTPFKYLHFSLGYFGLFYAQLAIMSGIRKYDSIYGSGEHTYLFWVHALVMIEILIVNESLYQKQVKAFSRVITDDVLEILTKEEV